MKLRMPFLEHRFRARALTAPGHDLLWPAQTRDQQKFGIFDSVVSGRPAPSPRRRASQDITGGVAASSQRQFHWPQAAELSWDTDDIAEI